MNAFFLCFPSDSKVQHQIHDEPVSMKSDGPFTELLETFQREDTKESLDVKSRAQVTDEDFYFEKQVRSDVN